MTMPMDPRFEEIFTSPENSVFQVVFYPDRIYHAQYLNATRSSRYRYNVREVRSKPDITAMKGEVYMDGKVLCNFLRIEYRAGRLVEEVREKGRFLQDQVQAWIRLHPLDAQDVAESMVKLHYCPWIDAYQVELWEVLEPPPGSFHDYKVRDLMGRDRDITRIPVFGPALRELKALKRIELAFSENDRDLPFGYRISERCWDNNFRSSHQEPRTQQPSATQNTIDDRNYLIDFQRGWFIQNAATVPPVRYRNGMMVPENPEVSEENVIEMRWLLQREFGSSVIFFHEVTIPPGTIEGTHRHVGSEELYYITQGEGIAYMGDGDDPATEGFPMVERPIYGLDTRACKELRVQPGSIIYTKSGGIHGIRNNSNVPLKFVAFLYHST